MGADHTAGNPAPAPGDPADKHGKGEALRNGQVGFTAMDDRRPECFPTEPLPNSGHVFDITNKGLPQVLPMEWWR